MNMTEIISNFNKKHAPQLITIMLIVNIWIFINTLFPVFELGMPALMLGLCVMTTLAKIDNEPLGHIIGKRVGAAFSKNNLISLISLFIITVCHQLLLLKYTWL